MVTWRLSPKACGKGLGKEWVVWMCAGRTSLHTTATRGAEVWTTGSVDNLWWRWNILNLWTKMGTHQKGIENVWQTSWSTVNPAKTGSPGAPTLPPAGARTSGQTDWCLVIPLAMAVPAGHSQHQTPQAALRNLSCTFGAFHCWFLLPFLPVPREQEWDLYREIILKSFHSNFEHNQRVKLT